MSNVQLDEEGKMVEQSKNNTEVLVAYNKIPYALLNKELDGSTQDTLDELTKICQYYKIYKEGKDFAVEGSNGDYVPANLHYRLAYSLVNKEARFLFAEPPDVIVNAKGDLTEVDKSVQEALQVMQDLVKDVLDTNMFEDNILKAAKDCFVGKRVAGLVNFNEEDGITLTFLPSTQFIYETKIGNPHVLTKFVCFMVIKENTNKSNKRIFKKKYELDNGKVFLEESIYDGAGRLIEDITERQEIKLDQIPAVICVNDGLLGETQGESEIALLEGYEEWYSKLSNGDTDAERKSMNPIRYTVDMDNRSTQNLSSAAGSYWDLQSDQNLDKPNPKAGILESNMSYSESLKTSLDRMKTSAYELVDVPNVSIETMTGTITSGKALRAIYWSLIVRCKEKMKMWGPQLRKMVEIIIDGAIQYPNCAVKHITDQLIPVEYEVDIVQNLPLPEDEQEEKTMDLAEVDSQVMSRKAYMKKWRELTDNEVDDELNQIAIERQIVQDSFTAMPGMETVGNGEQDQEDQFVM